MTGARQEAWLLRGLEKSPARWNVIAQQTMLAQFDFDARPGVPVFNMDQWDGYVAARQRLLNFLEQRQPSNPVVITGDIHSSWVHDLKVDFDNPLSATVGTEFVGTSITSDFPANFIPPVQAALTDNPHTKFFDGAYRGYVRCQLTRELWQSDFRAVSSILDENATIETRCEKSVIDKF
jgi:alkaline phosphatase D